MKTFCCNYILILTLINIAMHIEQFNLEFPTKFKFKTAMIFVVD